MSVAVDPASPAAAACAVTGQPGGCVGTWSTAAVLEPPLPRPPIRPLRLDDRSPIHKVPASDQGGQGHDDGLEPGGCRPLKVGARARGIASRPGRCRTLRNQQIAVECQMICIAAQEARCIRSAGHGSEITVLERRQITGLDAQMGGNGPKPLLAAREARLAQPLADLPRRIRTSGSQACAPSIAMANCPRSSPTANNP